MLEKVFLILLGVAAVASRHVNFYRKDYSYIDEYDAFYKFHWDLNGVSWQTSLIACDNEGAQLFYPSTGEEWNVVKKLVEASHLTPNVTDIFVGIHDIYSLGEFITVHGRPTTTPILNTNLFEGTRCVTMNIDSGSLEANECSPDNGDVRPFVCKKVEDVTCPTIDKGYKYTKETKKCYKVNDRENTWAEAMETCHMEGGILLVVTSEMEARVIRENVIKDDTYYAGLKKMYPFNEFYTVTGQKVHDSGFDRWYDENDRNSNRCGVVSDYNSMLYYKAVECEQKLPFVCEMEVNSKL